MINFLDHILSKWGFSSCKNLWVSILRYCAVHHRNMGFDSTIETLSMEAKLSLQLFKTFTKYDHGIATTNYQNKR